MKKNPDNIIISRSDSIGDVVLTLPVATTLKKFYPDLKIAFMGKAYTKPVIKACKSVDEFVDVEDFMKGSITIDGKKPQAILHVLPVAAIANRALQVRIPLRIGTTNRMYHWVTCNTLVKLSRRKSVLHEAQLNLKLLKPLGITREFSLKEVGESFSLEGIEPLPERLAAFIQKDKYNLILHPKSQGNGREWGLENFIQLIRTMNANRYNIFISGVEKERQLIQPLFNEVGNFVTDITGIMNLGEFISFISHCDGLVASGTGPLHVAAALGKDAFGIFPPIRPIHPERWAPLGPRAKAFVLEKDCDLCKANKLPCQCISKVDPLLIKEALDNASFSLGK